MVAGGGAIAGDGAVAGVPTSVGGAGGSKGDTVRGEVADASCHPTSSYDETWGVECSFTLTRCVQMWLELPDSKPVCVKCIPAQSMLEQGSSYSSN